MKKFLLSFSLAAISSMAVGASELVPVFQESFAECKSSVIQGGYFSEDYYFNSGEHSDNDGWQTLNAYVSERAIKFNAKTKHDGYATTPALNFSTTTAATVVVRFRAQKWAHKDDKVVMCVQVEGDASTKQTVDPTESTNVSDRSEAPYELTFTNVPDGSRFHFFTEKMESSAIDRCFLSDIVVLEEQASPAGAHIYTSAGYQHFDNLMIGNASEERYIDVYGVGLDSDIAVEMPAGEPSFRVAKADGWDARRGGRLKITFDPQVAGTADEKIDIVGGGAKRSVVLFGKSKVYAPVADDASAVAETSFTANWHRVAGLDRIELTVYTKEEAPLVATGLMFSKYIEGKSNNRAVEIFNGTGADVSLDGYRMVMESNGAGGFTFGEYAFEPDAVVKNGGTFTVCNAQFSALRDIADVTIGFNNGGYANIMTFTGDDAIGLFAPDGTLVDVLGYESTDVNDEVSGNWGMDKTFYRKSSCYEPSDKFIIGQWDEYAKDYCEGYGTHSLDATGQVRRVLSHLTLERGTTSAEIKDLPAGKPWFYTVQGHSGALKTLLSEEIAVGAAAGIDGTVADASEPLFTIDGDVLRTVAGATVCDILGRTVPCDASGAVRLPARGIYVVSAGGRSAKVAY